MDLPLGGAGLVETAIMGMKKVIDDYYVVEIKAIQGERIDSITLPQPESSDIILYATNTHPLPNNVLVEIFAQSSSPSPTINPSEYMTLRITEDHVIIVRVTIADTELQDPSILAKKSYRMTAALHRAVAKHAFLNLYGGVLSMIPHEDTVYETDEESNQVRRSTNKFLVRTMETLRPLEP